MIIWDNRELTGMQLLQNTLKNIQKLIIRHEGNYVEMLQTLHNKT